RNGLNGDRETLDQVGETLNITRERVRQIEKATLIRIKVSLDDGRNIAFNSAEMDIIKALHEMGRGARVDDLTKKIMGRNTEKDRAIVTLLAELSSKMLLTTENDKYHAAIVLTSDRDDRSVKNDVDRVVKALKQHGEPVSLDELYKLVGGNFEHPREVGAMASISKQVTSLRDMWGLTKWPSVNPRNIRDKIYVVLKESDQPMHFSDIAKAVKSENFHRNNVTEQAIHNELIKDDRFVLIGRGIYALAEQGYKKGSIVQVITELLRQNGPMHRDDIVREVLKMRQVRETTILLNLQSKPQFKRVAKNQYALAEA
ncbi:MAG: sigma factor-like helix-turn-helix DNA-binding protein, partial [Candidatus Saccharibacteria bacterium]|nr:sigma factor-like helix-turn-helix DNA-binding protein [Candidatus Saccharibacteria bacterium]